MQNVISLRISCSCSIFNKVNHAPFMLENTISSLLPQVSITVALIMMMIGVSRSSSVLPSDLYQKGHSISLDLLDGKLGKLQ